MNIWELLKPSTIQNDSTTGPVCLTGFVHSLLIALRARITNQRGNRNEVPLEEWQNETVPFGTMHTGHKGPLLPPSNRYLHCLLVIYAFSRFLMVYPVSITVSQFTISAVEDWIHSFGIPQSIVHGRGSAFIYTDFINWTKELGVTLRPRTAHSPQTNGKIETQNQHIARYWRNFLNDAGNNWSYVHRGSFLLTTQVSFTLLDKHPTR